MSLTSPRSQLNAPGQRRLFLLTLPKVPPAGCVNEHVGDARHFGAALSRLMHGVDTPAQATALNAGPLIKARSCPNPVCEESELPPPAIPDVTVNGRPVWAVRSPLSNQLPRRARSK